MTHLGVMALFSACVSAVFGTLLRDTPRQQLKTGAGIFAALTIGAYVVGWLMYFAF